MTINSPGHEDRESISPQESVQILTNAIKRRPVLASILGLLFASGLAIDGYIWSQSGKHTPPTHSEKKLPTHFPIHADRDAPIEFEIDRDGNIIFH